MIKEKGRRIITLIATAGDIWTCSILMLFRAAKLVITDTKSPYGRPIAGETQDQQLQPSAPRRTHCCVREKPLFSCTQQLVVTKHERPKLTKLDFCRVVWWWRQMMNRRYMHGFIKIGRNTSTSTSANMGRAQTELAQTTVRGDYSPNTKIPQPLRNPTACYLLI